MSEDESQRIDPYEIVIADLRSQRERIDNAIAAIETVRAVASPAATASPPPGPAQPSKSSEVGPGDLLGMSIADATKKLLAIKRTTSEEPGNRHAVQGRWPYLELQGLDQHHWCGAHAPLSGSWRHREG